MKSYNLPIPSHFDPERVDKVWQVAYQIRAEQASRWTTQHNLSPTSADSYKICLVAVDVQNTFCIPGFELYVGGRSGAGAVDDSRRLCEFIYRNLGVITQICPTMDTHQTAQIFHSIFLVDVRGEHPAPLTLISESDVRQGIWKFNSALADVLGVSAEYGQRLLEHYTHQLKASGKYDLTIWPYHAMLGGIGHALVSAVEEAIFFHSIARTSQPDFHVKGVEPLTEHYSVLGPEVRSGPNGELLAEKNDKFLNKLRQFDAVIIAGEAKSHCVAATIADLLGDILIHDCTWPEKVYLLEDCTSPVVVPGVIDYTDQADAAFRRFANAGMHLVHSTDHIADWPGFRL
jgi:nicotinamidase-related amidase